MHRIRGSVYGSEHLSFAEKLQKLDYLNSIETSADLLRLSQDHLQTTNYVYTQLQSFEASVTGRNINEFSPVQFSAQANCTCSFLDNCVQIFKDFPLSQKYLLEQNCTFIYELLGETRNDTVALFLSLYLNVSNVVNATEKDEFSQKHSKFVGVTN